MYGINTDKMQTIMSNIQEYNYDISSNISQIKSSINEVSRIFRNNDMTSIGNKLDRLADNYKKVKDVTNGYYNVLENVRKGYIAQDAEAASSIKKISENL